VGLDEGALANEDSTTKAKGRGWTGCVTGLMV